MTDKLLRSARMVLCLTFAIPFLWNGGTADSQRGSAVQSLPLKSNTHRVILRAMSFDPIALTVKQGDAVQWKNQDTVPHTVTAADQSFDSGDIAPGKSWKLVVKTPGTIVYFCSLHPNMHGEIVVTGGR